MSKAVAVEGDIIFETSTAKHSLDVDQKGKWELSNSTVTPGEQVSVGGKKVVIEAEATWQYLGATSNNVPVTVPPETVKLTASVTRLTDIEKHVLVDGDEAAGVADSGNRIKAVTSQSILTTD